MPIALIYGEIEEPAFVHRNPAVSWFGFAPLGYQPIVMSMPKRDLFVFYDGPVYPRLGVPFRRVTRMLQIHLQYRRNSRSREYMYALAQQTFSDFNPREVLELRDSGKLAVATWESVRTIVLLWPDSNGLGWSPIENYLLRHKPAGMQIIVLNGRRRRFTLGREQLRFFRKRRFLEKSFALDLAATLAFFLFTPILLFWDLLRGHS